MESKLNFIDLFAGASGMSEGFIKAGFSPVSHIEMNEEACYTIKTRAVYHYLTENKKSKIYNDYLQNKITRTDLYKQVPSKILDSVLNVEITDGSIKSLFSGNASLAPKIQDQNPEFHPELFRKVLDYVN